MEKLQNTLKSGTDFRPVSTLRSHIQINLYRSDTKSHLSIVLYDKECLKSLIITSVVAQLTLYHCAP